MKVNFIMFNGKLLIKSVMNSETNPCLFVSVILYLNIHSYQKNLDCKNVFRNIPTALKKRNHLVHPEIYGNNIFGVDIK